MAKQINTAPLSGMMELTPAAQLEFERLKHIIEETYASFGYTPLDTPVIERAEVLLAKAGGETEKQIYRFQKGDNDLGLRFDLTVPLSRYVVEHQADLSFPFRRSQIGKVYRGERPQKGRYREFYQCDVDVIGWGELPLLYDAEIIALIATTFNRLDWGEFTIRINNRKILNGFFQALNLMDAPEVMRVIDKAEKIGPAALEEELRLLRLDGLEIRKIVQLTQARGKWSDIEAWIKKFDLPENALFETGVTELKAINQALIALGVPEINYCFDLSIARGLDYYTGTVFETNLDEYPGLGSVCSGGRYDNLTGAFTKQKMPGVGASIGLTRLFSQLMEMGIVKADGKRSPSQILVLPVSEQMPSVLAVVKQLRDLGLKTEVYLGDGDLKKKMKYADNQGIEWVLLVGDEELASDKMTLKAMKTGEQWQLPVAEVAAKIS